MVFGKNKVAKANEAAERNQENGVLLKLYELRTSSIADPSTNFILRAQFVGRLDSRYKPELDATLGRLMRQGLAQYESDRAVSNHVLKLRITHLGVARVRELLS
jgi:hypothetical protein